MQAVGRLGSYLSKSVYTVSGPFHPFGGAVDIIVVEQPDGTYKSSPWYVRFGKFQGVLKTKEKVVSISVNGSEANFHMYLNHKGEAYFLQEDDEEEHDGDPMCSPPSSSGEDTERSTNESCAVRENSLERAQIAVNLLDLKWSTNLDSPRIKNDNIINNTNKIVAGDEVNRYLPVEDSHSGEENRIEMECVAEKYVISTTTSADGLGEMQIHDSIEKDKGNPQFTLIHEKRVSISGHTHTASETITECSQSILIHKSNEKFVSRDDAISECGSLDGPLFESQISNFDNREPTISNEEQLVFGNLDDFCSVDSKVDSLREAKCFSLDQAVIDDYINDVDQQWIGLRPVSSESCIKENGNVHPKVLQRLVRSLPIAGPLGDMLEASDECQTSVAHTTFESVVIVQEREEGHANLPTDTTPRPIDSLIGNQRTWPFTFKRSKSMKSPRVEIETIENYNPAAAVTLTSPANLEVKKDVIIVKERKRKFVRTLTPTSQQLASINLKEGKNIVVFTFQTGMLGKQQVDARIFIWRWDTRIVISDVDGTITRSDLLGQVMPLVGMDWSHTGVAHLFSAIKENGYQLLFLSARSIAQSFLTRQFLSNIRQDGKALPDGPVVISPDGLFPSLFREVIRRAPHEFKIACLEDIKALFPADTNPFYAGFGNRHTDEFSYLKVGIPRGKIFIINPKGEIVVNRRVDTKSYVSLHAIVHGMFPTMSSYEQEDFNSWNYWKLPPPMIDS